ncbi:MAG TPA: hypothetical protein VFE62_26365 [Gemmataceae bacterium]|nr:hypothetical protein [Gemmataceae bacterium]
MPVLTRGEDSQRDVARGKTKRRGATAMEYLMVISLIFVVCMIAIGYVGSSNNANMSYSTNAITKAIKK